MLRRIPLGKMLNLRDLGGYPTRFGGTTAWGRILRGDNPMGLSEADVAWLLERGITTVIDLRSPGEAAHLPDELRGRTGFRYFHIPLSDGAQLPGQKENVGLGYAEMLGRREDVAQVLRGIAGAPGGVLFHCMAGKDRTGCIAALLLDLAGVGRLDILADYMVSELYIRPVIQHMRQRLDEIPAYVGTSRPQYLEECLALLEERYGSLDGYRAGLGLTAGELERLRNKLLAE